MFNGQITFVGATPSEDTVRECVRIAERLRGEKEAAGMSQAIKGYDLPDGTQVYVADLSDVWTVQIIPPVEPLEHGLYEPSYDVFPISEPLRIISFISGAVTTGIGEDIEVEFVAADGETIIVSVFAVVNSDFTVKRVIGGSPPKTAELFTAEEAAIKVGVPQHLAFKALDDDTPRTQFHSHDPGLFTGAMSSLVQLLLGVGRVLGQDYERRLIDAVPGRAQPLMQETFTLGEVETDVLEVQSLMQGEAEHDLYQTQIQLTYDYRWNRTHGIAWGDRTALEFAPSVELMADPHRAQEPFLVELSNRGILAMPLPRDIASFYPEVREQYLRIYPELNEYRVFNDAPLFDALGGFPTGAGMPMSPVELDRYKRAGIVFESDRDLSDFYSGFAFSSGHGWAFADNGRKAINVCRKWRDGFQFGECYEVEFEIQQRSNIEFQAQAEMMIQRLELTDFVDIYKVHRLTDDQVHHIVTPGLRGNHESEYEAFDAVEVQPDWVLGAVVTKIREGSVTYNRAMCTMANNSCFASADVQFKIYDPVLGFQAVTVDFTVNPEMLNGREYEGADGPIFATYVRNSPEILHFYNKPGATEPGPGSDRQPCQFVGEWLDDQRSRWDGVTGHFYSSTRDFRESHAIGSGKITWYNASLAGYGDFACKCDFWAMYVALDRRKYYAYSWESEEIASRYRRVSIVCATNNRSAYFACDQTLLRNRELREGYSGRKSIGSTGVILEGGIYHFIWHWTNFCGGSPWGSTPLDGDYKVFKRKTNESGCAAMLWPNEAPEDITGQYSIWNVGASGTPKITLFTYDKIVVSSPFPNNAVLLHGCIAYNAPPTLPESWSRTVSEADEIEYEIYGFGLPEMNGRLLRKEKYIQGEDEPALEFNFSGASMYWWQCAVPWLCPVDPWHVTRNHYGVPFVQTNSEFVFGDTVEYGRRPELAGGFGHKLFGVVE